MKDCKEANLWRHSPKVFRSPLTKVVLRFLLETYHFIFSRFSPQSSPFRYEKMGSEKSWWEFKSYFVQWMFIFRTFFIEFAAFAKTFVLFLGLFELNTKSLPHLYQKSESNSKRIASALFINCKCKFISLILSSYLLDFSYIGEKSLLIISMNILLLCFDGIFTITMFWWDFWQHLFFF